MMATPKVAYNYDKEAYMHGYCQYFAFEAQKMYGGKICLWLDLDEMSGTERLCHAFLEIAPGFCLDAYGVFSNLDERTEEFEYNYINVVSCTHKEAEEVLKRIKLKYTDSTLKKNAREYLRNNRLFMRVRHSNGSIYPFTFSARTDAFGKDRILVNTYNEKEKKSNSLTHTLSVEEILNGLVEKPYMIEDINWYYRI